jgi:hypothetical protein
MLKQFRLAIDEIQMSRLVCPPAIGEVCDNPVDILRCRCEEVNRVDRHWLSGGVEGLDGWERAREFDLYLSGITLIRGQDVAPS